MVHLLFTHIIGCYDTHSKSSWQVGLDIVCHLCKCVNQRPNTVGDTQIHRCLSLRPRFSGTSHWPLQNLQWFRACVFISICTQKSVSGVREIFRDRLFSFKNKPDKQFNSWIIDLKMHVFWLHTCSTFQRDMW